MSSALRENWIEAAVGLGVILLAGWFLSFAAGRTGGAASGSSYALSARFPNVNGISEGTDIRVSGMKVGTVTSVQLDPQTYQANVKFELDSSIKLPSDSSAAITSEGLLGGTYIALIPGGDPTPLKSGDVITDTQGAQDLMGLVGSFVNRSGSSGDSSGASGGAATPGAAQAK